MSSTTGSGSSSPTPAVHPTGTPAAGPAAPAAPTQITPAFIIGVTGNNDPVGYLHSAPPAPPPAQSIRAIEQTVFDIIHWLRFAPEKGQPTGRLDPCTHRWLPDENTARDTKAAYHSCWQPLALGETPIVFLSSLAPGIDTLVAEAVFKYQDLHPGAPVTVRAPLPFPEDVYRNSSSFKVGDPAPDAPGVLNDLRARYDAVLTRLRRQPGFDPARDIFCVPLHESIDGDPVADLSQIDPTTQRPRRYLRYRAAGEYIAAYSDILLAFYDEVHAAAENLNPFDPFTAGTAAIVEAKRRGLTDRLLPIPKTISWADTGPVLHIPIDRKKNPHVAARAASRPLRLLQPYDALPDEQPQMGTPPDLLPRWQENGDRILRDMAFNLSRYQQLLRAHRQKAAADAAAAAIAAQLPAPPARWWRRPQPTAPPAPEGSLRNLLKPPAGVYSPVPSSGQTTAQVVTLALGCQTFPFDKFASLRDETAAISRARDAKLRKIQVFAFRLAILSVTFFVASGMDWATFSVISETMDHWIRGLAFGIAATIFILGIWRLKRGANRELEDMQFDYRAIAEGMRVQSYWSLSGLFSSVASRYIQRLRGELGWIRCVVSSATFPYLRTKTWFDNLTLQQKHDVLCSVRDGWLRGQHHYFKGAVYKAALQRDSWRAIARALAWTAFLVAGFTVYADVCGKEIYRGSWEKGNTLITATAIVLGTLAFFWVSEWLCRPGTWHPVRTAPSRQDVKWHFWRLFFPTFWHDRWMGTQKSAQRFITYLHGICSFLLGLGIAILWAYVPQTWPCHCDSAPVLQLTGGGKSLLLALSGFAFLWIEKCFFEENHHRYSAMQELYAGAEQRMSHKLERLHAQLAIDAPPPTAPKIVNDIQDLLLHLGQEALSENAEWIVMRRTRRIEPITPDL